MTKRTTAKTTDRTYTHTPGYCPGCGVDVFDPENRNEHGTIDHDPTCEVERAAIVRRADLRERLAAAANAAALLSAERNERRGRTPRAERAERVEVERHKYVRGERARCATCGGARNIKAHDHMHPKEA